jgi:transcriptional regulator with XRE-family HTH domain
VPNERLRNAVAAAGLTIDQVAQQVEVDPKTVERWITKDRLPHRRHRWAVAKLVANDETYLWPATVDDVRTKSASEAEFITLYPHRGAVPQQLLDTLIDRATDSIDILVFAGLFLFDTHPDLDKQLTTKARAGLKSRLLFGEPASEVVRERADEEGIGEGLAARIRTSLRYLKDMPTVPGIEVRLHETNLYNSLYRFDDDLLVNMHVYGAPAAQNPVMHLRRVPGGRLFDHYMTSFDSVWAQATPLAPHLQP